jgi:hypothetical protein
MRDTRYCNYCQDEGVPVRPYGSVESANTGYDLNICEVCAEREHERGRITPWSRPADDAASAATRRPHAITLAPRPTGLETTS